MTPTLTCPRCGYKTSDTAPGRNLQAVHNCQQIRVNHRQAEEGRDYVWSDGSVNFYEEWRSER